MAGEDDALKAALEADARWRADMLQTQIEIRGFLEAVAQAQHAQLAALADVVACLRLPPAEPLPGEAVEPGETIAEILDGLADDVHVSALGQGLIQEDEDEGSG